MKQCKQYDRCCIPYRNESQAADPEKTTHTDYRSIVYEFNMHNASNAHKDRDLNGT